MIKLEVNNFSCITSADLELGEITLIIGPQASGKSVLCKLNYFFFDILEMQYASISDGLTYKAFTEALKDKFIQWFPISAWGSGVFNIQFTAGDFGIRFTRTTYKEKPNDNFRIWISKEYEMAYKSISRRPIKDENEFDFSYIMDIRSSSRKNYSKILGADYIERHIFVPAGRSFFTNIGKALSLFEHGRVLDPLTLSFGRIYASFRDGDSIFYTRTASKNNKVLQMLNEILGGEIKSKRNEEYVLSNDGRKIPFSALSSGQQELLPLITVLPIFISSLKGDNKALTYIEEPEAHLFPKAQSSLITALNTIINLSDNSLKMVLTTHSPYVLSKFNNLIKAYMIGQNPNSKEKVEKILPKTSWLNPSHIKAYAIKDQCLVNIIDSEGFISGEYLDQVSDDISNEYSELLRIEFPDEP